MASELIGRTACPECGFPHAHVKIKTDKEGAQPYRHCPECSAQYFTRSKLQADNLRKQMRPEGAPAPQTPREEPPQKPANDVNAEPAPEQRYTYVLGVRVPV